jgi:cytochrome c oxidase cbb3-type subunit III
MRYIAGRVVLGVGMLAAALVASPLDAQSTGGSAPAQQDQQAQDPKLKNPFEVNEANVAEGRRLYMRFNCYGCHGTQGGGGMGPSLISGRWRYGTGTDVDLFKSITEGRPNGMPPFGAAIKEEERWKIITYIRSLYKGDRTASGQQAGYGGRGA